MADERIKFYYQDKEGDVRGTTSTAPTPDDKTVAEIVVEKAQEENCFKTINGESIVGEGDITVGGMSNPMTTTNDIIVGGTDGAPTRLAKGNTGDILKAGENSIYYAKGLPVITTAPSSANTDGIIICVLHEEPATKYDGYLYLIT